MTAKAWSALSVRNGPGRRLRGRREYADTFDATVNSGTIEIEFRPYLIPDSLNVYYPPRKSNGKSIADTGGPVSTLTLKNPIITPFKNWPTSLFEIVVNEGSKVDSITIWDYVVTVKDDDGKVVKTYTSSYCGGCIRGRYRGGA